MKIAAIHRYSRQTYGAPRIHQELTVQGVRLGRKRIARLMRAAGLRGVSRRKWIVTTVRDREARPAPNLVERNFTAATSNRLWVADLTYIPTWAGFRCLAVVLDVFSRRIVGWAMEPSLRTELVLKALDMALGRRMRTRLGTPKAIPAAAHKLARVIYHLLTTRQSYQESVFARCEALYQQRLENRIRRQARELGLALVRPPT